MSACVCVYCTYATRLSRRQCGKNCLKYGYGVDRFFILLPSDFVFFCCFILWLEFSNMRNGEFCYQSKHAQNVATILVAFVTVSACVFIFSSMVLVVVVTNSWHWLVILDFYSSIVDDDGANGWPVEIVELLVVVAVESFAFSGVSCKEKEEHYIIYIIFMIKNDKQNIVE